MHFLLRPGPLENARSVTPVPLMELLSNEAGEAMQSPRILHSHAAPETMPSDAFKRGRKFIFTIRNPKDTAVSMFYHAKKDPFFGPSKISWECFIDIWTKGLCRLFYLVY